MCLSNTGPSNNQWITRNMYIQYNVYSTEKKNKRNRTRLLLIQAQGAYPWIPYCDRQGMAR